MRPGPSLTDRYDLVQKTGNCNGCGRARWTENGARELPLGVACPSCGSFAVRLPRRLGQALPTIVEPTDGLLNTGPALPVEPGLVLSNPPEGAPNA